MKIVYGIFVFICIVLLFLEFGFQNDIIYIYIYIDPLLIQYSLALLPCWNLYIDKKLEEKSICAVGLVSNLK